MNTKIKTVIISIVSIVILITIVIAALFLRVACTDDIYDTISSPDGKMSAVIFSRNCGATTGFNYQISILPFGVNPKGGGNIFVADKINAYSIKYKLEWKGNKMINIRVTSDARIFKKENNFSGVLINYLES